MSASERTLIPLDTKLRYTTMILLPEEEEILDVVCGDNDFWVISATQNIAHVKPAKEGAATNLNLVTASGSVYSFLLTEGKTPQPDLKVYVTADPSARRQTEVLLGRRHVALQAELTECADRGGRRPAASGRGHRDVSSSSIPRSAVHLRRRRSTRSRSSCDQSGTTGNSRTSSPTPGAAGPVQGEGRQPALVNFQVQRGTYVIPKVLDRGYLALGNANFAFRAGTVSHGRNTPGTAPVTDRRTPPRGVLPRGAQTWFMVALALGILAIIVFTGQPAPPAGRRQRPRPGRGPNPIDCATIRTACACSTNGAGSRPSRTP